MDNPKKIPDIMRQQYFCGFVALNSLRILQKTLKIGKMAAEWNQAGPVSNKPRDWHHGEEDCPPNAATLQL